MHKALNTTKMKAEIHVHVINNCVYNFFDFRCTTWCLVKDSRHGSIPLHMQSAPMLISGSTHYQSLFTEYYSAQTR